MLKVSRDGRGFLDGTGSPVFFLGDTQWQLFHGYSREAAIEILKNRAGHGFNFIHVMLLGLDPGPNVAGDTPFLDGDCSRPDDAWFANVDALIAEAAALNLYLVIGVWHQRYPADLLPPEQCRAWGRFLGERYRGQANLVWSMYPESCKAHVPICADVAAGLREGDGGAHLITIHPDPSPASSSDRFNDIPELDFHSIQTFKDVDLILPMIQRDQEVSPDRPTILAEGAYEAGIEYGFEVTPLWVRRQAYYSYLSGGHHTYGHNDSWRINPTWRAALDAEGARQMGLLRRIFESLPAWWALVPDQSLLLEGGCVEGDRLVLAARHPDADWILVYAAEACKGKVDTTCVDGKDLSVCWIDPRTGDRNDQVRATASASLAFALPPDLEDGLLLILAREA